MAVRCCLFKRLPQLMFCLACMFFGLFPDDRTEAEGNFDIPGIGFEILLEQNDSTATLSCILHYFDRIRRAGSGGLPGENCTYACRYKVVTSKTQI